MKIIFIVNNKNNRLKKRLPALRSHFEACFPGQAEFQFTLRKWHAAELARLAAEKGCDFVIAVGGDGTLHEVINGLLLSNIPPNDRPAAGLLPLGSANDFARTAGITSSPDDLEKWVSKGSTRKIDVGMIQLVASGETRYFINVAGLGLGAEVVQLMSRAEPVFGAAIHYYQGIFRGFRKYCKKEVSLRSNSWQWKGKILQIAVANGRFFGNGICIAPQAVLEDGSLNISIFGDLSLWDYIKNIGNLKKGKLIKHPQVTYQITAALLLEGEGCGIEADGEFVGYLPANISIRPAALSFLMPTGVEK